MRVKIVTYGSGYTNLVFATLRQAQKDRAKMWREFKQTKTYKRGTENVDSFSVASDLGSYLGK